HNAKFLAQIDWLEAFLKDLSPPKYPLPVDEKLAAQGKQIYAATCPSCHEAGPNGQMGKVVDISKIGTDRNRLDTWTQQAADLANSTVEKLGIRRIGLQKTSGYVPPPMDGIWLRAPYLHNGSVPNMHDLDRKSVV